MENEKYYYIRDEVKTSENGLGRPIITVCLIRIGNAMARGIAVCSDLDQPCKKKGRTIARTRAIYALSKEAHGCEIKREELYNSIIMDNFVPELYKSCYQPELTDFELKLFSEGEKDADIRNEMP